MEIIKRTDIGHTRKKNQDYIDYIKMSDDEAFLIVCDGLGGHAAGEVASKLTAQYILEHFEFHEEFKDDDSIRLWLHSLIREANGIVYDESIKDKDLNGMGTTVTVAYVYKSYAYFAHVGDSRAYLIDDAIDQITVDDTLVNALVENGSISKLEARFHPQKNILLQAIGVSSPLSISFSKQKIDNRSILICTDGLYNAINDDMILDIFHSFSTLDEIGDELIEKANYFGGFDNISFIILKKGEAADESH